jgi:hypothetical protein
MTQLLSAFFVFFGEDEAAAKCAPLPHHYH